MANNASQKKRNRQTVVLTERNKAVRSEIRTRTARALEAAEAGDSEAATSALAEAQRRIDSAVARGVLHRNTAGRKKSRLTRRVHSLLGA